MMQEVKNKNFKKNRYNSKEININLNFLYKGVSGLVF